MSFKWVLGEMKCFRVVIKVFRTFIQAGTITIMNFNVFHDHDCQKLYPFSQNPLFVVICDHDCESSLFIAIMIKSTNQFQF